MTLLIIIPLLLSIILYLAIGFSNQKHIKSLADLIPIKSGNNARVESSDEFSSSTVAATISLATVVLAYFELARYFGLWLLWTAITTAIGLLVVSKFSPLIWKKISKLEKKPSMHRYLGIEYDSRNIEVIGALCTSIGFLLVYATELIVGSQFLAKLLPNIPEIYTVIILSSVGFIYTVTGGFRAVIKTDQIQMKFIWIFIVMMLAFFIVYVFSSPDPIHLLGKMPRDMYDFSYRPGLLSFLCGIAVMNIPLYISNMAIWQRVAGTNDPQTLQNGLKTSVYGSLVSWCLLAVIACLGYIVVIPESNITFFTDILLFLSTSTFGKFVLFASILGMFGAMLSSASTNLIVLAHTIYEDLYTKKRGGDLSTQTNATKELNNARLILMIVAILAVFLVMSLRYMGFSIADLAFSIYGGGLALSPVIITALLIKKEILVKLKASALFAIILGFISGWTGAIYGKIAQIPDLVFLSPCFSFGVSSIIIITFYIYFKNEDTLSKSSGD